LDKPNYNDPIVFGLYHTDHILEINHDTEIGWEKPIISPYHKLQIDPANSSLHYAIQLFEGMKAFRNITNSEQILLFRPDMNMKRMNISAKRIGLPVNFLL
jgi:branched-chain amino acid aminotransferase